jgi:hypothetical protein
MPTTLNGRQLISEYLNKHDISTTSLAAAYGVGKVYMGQVLSGARQSAAANELVLKIIDDYKIRPEIGAE